MLIIGDVRIRTYQNLFSRLKLIFLIAAGVNVWIFHTGASDLGLRQIRKDSSCRVLVEVPHPRAA